MLRLAVVLVLGAVSFVLLIAEAAAAGLALATATAIGGLFWRLCSQRVAGGDISVAALIGAGHGGSGAGRRAGAAILEYLRRLPEAQ